MKTVIFYTFARPFHGRRHGGIRYVEPQLTNTAIIVQHLISNLFFLRPLSPGG